MLNDFNKPPSCIALQEIWQDKNNTQINDYNKTTLTRTNKRGGGLALLTSPELDKKIINEMTFINSNIEIQTVKLKATNKNTVIISNIYRPPSHLNANFNIFIEKLTDALNYKKNNFGNIPHYICGDFNVDLKSNNSYKTNLINTMESNNLHPMFNKPTRIQNNTSTIIDNIYSDNFNNLHENYLIPHTISDHLLLLHITNYKSSHNCTTTITTRSFNDTNINNFAIALQNTNFDDCINSNDCIAAHNIFFNILDSTFNTHFPPKQTKSTKKKHKPWITTEIQNDIKKERKLYIKAINKKTDRAINDHKTHKMHLQKLIRQSKIRYHSNFLHTNKLDSRKIWSHLNEEMNRSSNNKQHITEIKTNNRTLDNNKEMADAFNNFYSSIGEKIANNINFNQAEHDTYINNIPSTNLSFKFKQINTAELLTINRTIKNKKSCGPDNIPSIITKTIINKIPAVICHLINLSLTSGKVHNRYKCATVISIHKKGAKDDMNNYRPISLINTLAKILEKVVCKQLRLYLEQNNLIFAKQFGFRNHHSTEHAIASTIAEIENNLFNNRKTNSIFIDLTKAFDTINHTILCKKMEKLGIKNNELSWFISYLENRTIQSKINNTLSKPIHIKTGVPQGSVLGPILFLIYINDFALTLDEDISTHLFADDTRLDITDTHTDSLHRKTEKALMDAQKWFTNNLLSMNPAKTKIIKTNHTDNRDINIDNTTIDCIHSNNLNKQDKSFKFLGFHLDEKHDLLQHKQEIIKKLNSSIYILNKIKNTFPTKQKMLIFNSLFQSHLLYGLCLWSKNNHLINKIKTLQKKAIKIASGNRIKSHSEHIFKKYKILKLDDQIQLSRAIFAHSIKYKYAPVQTTTIMTNVQPHSRLRRNLLNFTTDHTHKDSLFKYIIPTCWNNLDDSIKSITNKNKFKNKIKKNILTSYSATINCRSPNCYICNN